MNRRVSERRDESAPMNIVFYLPNLAGGGAETLTLLLCEALIRRGHAIRLVVDRLEGNNVARIPAKLEVISLADRSLVGVSFNHLGRVRSHRDALLEAVRTTTKPRFVVPRVLALADVLRERPCDVLIAALGYTPFVAHWAARVAETKARVVAAEHNTPSAAFFADGLSWRRLFRLNQVKTLMRTVYPRLDGLIAVSDGVAEDTADFARLERRAIRTIYNPVPVEPVIQAAKASCDHPWSVDDDIPLIVTVGRLVPQKNQRLLIDAVRRLNDRYPVRLLIVGDGPLRDTLAAHVDALGLADRVSFTGWQANPYTFMRAASVFVLSSDREGLGNVLIEALACGTPVVSTDCRSGPREILEDGRHGRLVPTHDSEALADAIDATLNAPPDREALRARASFFSIERAADAYEGYARELKMRLAP